MSDRAIAEQRVSGRHAAADNDYTLCMQVAFCVHHIHVI